MIRKQKKKKSAKKAMHTTTKPRKPVFNRLNLSSIPSNPVFAKRFVHWTGRPVRNILLLCLAVIKIIYLNVMLLTRLIVLILVLFVCVCAHLWMCTGLECPSFCQSNILNYYKRIRIRWWRSGSCATNNFIPVLNMELRL